MKGKIWRKILSVCLVLLMVAALVPAQLFSVSAESSVSFIYRWWDSATNQVKSETQYANAHRLQDYDDGMDDLYSGWYYSSGYKVFSDRVTVHGTVNIIICEEGGSYVQFKDGIHVSPGNTLNIYGQGNETQSLEAFAGTNDYAGIGGNGNEECGTINIYGGKVTAKADVDAAGIGGGFKGYGGHINIYGGIVDATGGSVNTNGGAGIGGGGQGWGGYIKIYGGDVTAHGGKAPAAMLKSSVVPSTRPVVHNIPTAAQASAAVMKKASIISSSTAVMSQHRAAVTAQASAAVTPALTAAMVTAISRSPVVRSTRPAANTARVSAAVKTAPASKSSSITRMLPPRAADTARVSAAETAEKIIRSLFPAARSTRPAAKTARASAAATTERAA